MGPTRCQVLLAILMTSATLLAGEGSAAVPDWVRPGMSLTYEGMTASIQDGQPVSGMQMVMTTTVDRAAENSVSGSTRVDIPNAPTYGWTYNWTAVEGESWRDVHRFWVDPKDPTASVRGPEGEELSVVGQEIYEREGKTWQATIMAARSQGAEVSLTYETESGLILAYAEKRSSQHLSIFLGSAGMAADGTANEQMQVPD